MNLLQSNGFEYTRRADMIHIHPIIILSLISVNPACMTLLSTRVQCTRSTHTHFLI